VLVDVTTGCVCQVPLNSYLDDQSFLLIVDPAHPVDPSLLGRMLAAKFNWLGVALLGLRIVVGRHKTFRWRFLGDAATTFLIPGVLLWPFARPAAQLLGATFLAYVVTVVTNRLRRT
jgi:hypothetical protein